MNLTATHLIDQFCLAHPSARIPLARWVGGVSASTFTNFNQLKQVFPHADYAAPFTIFNVGGNNYRVISRIEYSRDTLDIYWILTHSDYDKWTCRFKSGKSKL
jgi:mRNA interferase HigB